jgi:hypothetical protein
MGTGMYNVARTPRGRLPFMPVVFKFMRASNVYTERETLIVTDDGEYNNFDTSISL